MDDEHMMVIMFKFNHYVAAAATALPTTDEWIAVEMTCHRII